MMHFARNRLRRWMLFTLYVLFVAVVVHSQVADIPTEQTIDDRGDVLTGRIQIKHPKFDSHRFVKSYIYVFELNEYIDVAPDGTFEVVGVPQGRYSFKSYVPGFEPTYATVFFPDQRHAVIVIELQISEVQVVTVRKAIPAYLRDIRILVTTPEVSDETRPTTPIPLPVPEGQRTGPSISLNDIGDFFINLFKRDKEKE